MDRKSADVAAIQIANSILKTEPSRIIRNGSSSSQAASQVADFIKILSDRLQEDMDSVVVNFGELR